MFHDDSDTNEEGIYLRSGIILWLNKRIRLVTRRESCSVIKNEDYELVPQLNDESCDKEEYHINSKDKEEVLDPYQTQGYDIHMTSHTSSV